MGVSKIECAHARVSAEKYGSGYAAIAFNSKFKQKPYVCVTVETEWVDALRCTITDCDVSGLNVKLYNGSSQNVNLILVHVIAVGYI